MIQVETNNGKDKIIKTDLCFVHINKDDTRLPRHITLAWLPAKGTLTLCINPWAWVHKAC